MERAQSIATEGSIAMLRMLLLEPRQPLVLRAEQRQFLQTAVRMANRRRQGEPRTLWTGRDRDGAVARPKSSRKFSLTLAQRGVTRLEVSYEGAATGPDSRSGWYVIKVAATGWCALETRRVEFTRLGAHHGRQSACRM